MKKFTNVTFKVILNGMATHSRPSSGVTMGGGVWGGRAPPPFTPWAPLPFDLILHNKCDGEKKSLQSRPLAPPPPDEGLPPSPPPPNKDSVTPLRPSEVVLLLFILLLCDINNKKSLIEVFDLVRVFKGTIFFSTCNSNYVCVWLRITENESKSAAAPLMGYFF